MGVAFLHPKTIIYIKRFQFKRYVYENWKRDIQLVILANKWHHKTHANFSLYIMEILVTVSKQRNIKSAKSEKNWIYLNGYVWRF